jgi:hypothetical protein
MNEIVINGRRVVRELLIFAGCFFAALGVNAYAIIRFGTEWKELFTTLHITLAVALIFFAVVAILRGAVFCCRRLIGGRAA